MKRKPAYIDFTKAVLETIEENPQKTRQEIQDIILEKYDQFTQDDINEDDNQIQRVIRYLTLAEFTTQDDDGRCVNTSKGSQQLEFSNLQINKIIKKILTIQFKIPKERDLCYICLNYFKDYPSHPIGSGEMLWDMLKKTSKYAENKDICELRAAKGTPILYSKYDFSNYHLKKLDLVKKTEDKGYQITQKGLDILNKYETEEEVNEYIDTLFQQSLKNKDEPINKILASDDGHIKVFYYDYELTYLEVLIPLLKIIDSKYYTNQEEKIKDIIIKMDEFESYDKEDIIKAIDTALHYLYDREYITIESGEILKTAKLAAIVYKLDYRMKYVDSLDIEESEKDKKRQKRLNNICREINKSLFKVYDVPTKEDLYQDILKYLKDDDNRPVNHQKLPSINLLIVQDFLEKHKTYSDNIMSIIDPESRRLSINLIIEDAFKELKQNKLIRNTKKYGYLIEEKGIRYLEKLENENKTEDIKKSSIEEENIKPELVDEDNNKIVSTIEPIESKTSEFKNRDMTTDNIYERLVFDILCDNEEHEKVDIIDKIEETLIPGVVIPKEIKNVIKDNIQDALDKFAQYNIIEPGERFGYWKITQKAMTIAHTIDSETPTVNIVSETPTDVDNEIDIIDEDIIESPLEDEIENETIEDVEVIDKQEETTEFIEINPVDTFKKAYGAINKDLKRRLLNKVKSCSPYFFEKLVLDLFMKMDYNHVKPKYGEVTKKSNDGGIDGVIQLGYLNTNPIYYQAKRYDSNIQRPAIHQFIGALREIKSDTGIFITTSGFSKGAIKAAKSENISMIDGDELVSLMIEFKIGVKVKNYDIKLIDDEYFED